MMIDQERTGPWEGPGTPNKALHWAFRIIGTATYLSIGTLLWGWRVTVLLHLLRAGVAAVFIVAGKLVDPVTRAEYARSDK